MVATKSQAHMYVRQPERMDTSLYHLPFVSTGWLMQRTWARAMPVLPSFTGYRSWRPLLCCRKKEEEEEEQARGGRRGMANELRRLRSISEERIPPNPCEQQLL